MNIEQRIKLLEKRVGIKESNKKGISLEDFRDLGKREQLDYFCEWISDNWNFHCVPFQRNIIVPLLDNKMIKTKSKFQDLEESVYLFCSLYLVEYFLDNKIYDSSEWGEYYKVSI